MMIFFMKAIHWFILQCEKKRYLTNSESATVFITGHTGELIAEGAGICFDGISSVLNLEPL